MIEIISTLAELPELIADDGTVILCEEDDNYYRFENKEWKIVQIDKDKVNTDGLIELSLYDINKQIISQLPEFGEAQWDGAEKVLYKWLENTSNKFFMLYGKEISYFTLFHKVKNKDNAEFNSFFEAVKDCLTPFNVKAFDIIEDNSAIEIWCELSQEEETITTCMYLFPYDEGVVRYYE